MKKVFLLCLCFAVSLLMAGQGNDVVVTKETVSTFYRDFKRLTQHPHRVAPLTAILCRSPTPELRDREQKATGLHYHTSVHIYANALADAAIAAKANVFPPGAIIVKEKLDEKGSAVGVGGMIKRAAGFDAANADWEYFYSDAETGFSMGRLKNCAECHAGADRTDYVFSVWKPYY